MANIQNPQGVKLDRRELLMLGLVKMASLCFLLAFLSLGCTISIAQNKLPTLAKLPDRSAIPNKPSAYLDVKFLVDLSGGKQPAFEHPPATAKLKEIVEKVTKDSGLFSRYTFEPFFAKDAEYYIKIEMLNHGSAGAAAGAGFFSGLTFGIIPGGVTDHYKLTGKVVDRNGKELAAYELEDAVDSWIGIWFVPGVGSRPHEVVPAVLENMVKTLYWRIANDKVLGY